MNKKELRATFSQRRLDLSREELDTLNESLLEQVKENLPIEGCGSVHIFLPIENRKEIDTWRIVAWIRAEHPRVKIAVPVMNYAAHLMKHAIIEADTEFQLDKYNIPTPVTYMPISPEEIDLVITPLLAIDKNGYRVGYGKGHYDRFFATCRPDVLKVGISLFDPVDDISDRDGYDIAMDFCATPRDYFSFILTQ